MNMKFCHLTLASPKYQYEFHMNIMRLKHFMTSNMSKSTKNV